MSIEISEYFVSTDISEYEDIIDGRDIIARIDDLESEREQWEESELFNTWTLNYPDEATELDELVALRDEAESNSVSGDTCRDGLMLIRDSHFEDYCRDLAEDCGMIPDDRSWPMTHIDWDAAATEALMDYGQIEFRGVTYYVR